MTPSETLAEIATGVVFFTALSLLIIWMLSL